MKYSITISDWYEDRKEYLDALQTANVYFAPRLYEGIGMSFIEAMTMGKCVVAVDHPTMNEYVDNGVNGYLYDLRRAQSLDLSTVREMGKKARESCSLGFKRWVAARDMILEFVSARNCGVENRARTFAGFAARTVFYPVQFLKKVRNVVNRIVMKCST
jgi:glycosyltransferase involved in cell wall biosynthesis